MQGYFSLLLHAHLPYVRHPEHPRFLEENWLFEAITECYIPLIEKIEGWIGDSMHVPFTLTLTPTVCAMLIDPLLQSRYSRYLDELIDLAERETHRTHWDKALQPLSSFYLERFQKARGTWNRYQQNLLNAFRAFQDQEKIEIITSAATHALLPLMESYPESIRAQVLVARDHYKSCFGRDPRGIWLPECAYVAGVENVGSMVICQYENGQDDTARGLRAVVRLTPDRARAVVDAIAASPIMAPRPCQTPIRRDLALLIRFEANGVVREVYLQAGGCADGTTPYGGFDDGTNVRTLTRAGCQAVLISPAELWGSGGYVGNACLG